MWRSELGVFEKRVYIPVKLRHLYSGKSRKSVYAKKEGECVAIAQALRRDIDEGKAGHLTFGVYLSRWLEWLEALGLVSERTLQDYRYYAEKHLIPEDKLGSSLLVDLAAEDLDGLYARLAKRGMGPRGVYHVHATARVALQRAVKKRLIPYNPARDADPPPYSTDGREYSLLDWSQVESFLGVAEGDRFEALWYVAMFAGPRPHELRTRKWEDVSLERGVAVMRRSVVELKGQPPKIGNSTKTGKGRAVPLLPEVVWALKTHRERQYDERFEFQGLWRDENLVFPNSRGSPMARANLTNRHYKPILGKAGLPKETRLYDLRHTLATLWVEGGEDMGTLSGILGHVQISTTSDRYVYPSDRARAEAMARFGARLR